MKVERAECMRCADCKFLYLIEAIDVEGTCRRRAPITLRSELPMWPRVPIDYWCGDGKLRFVDQPSVAADPILLEGVE